MRNKTNFVIIYPDSLTFRALGCYGNPIAKTPNIDSLAEKGVVFTECTSQNPLCQPSRASLYTGQYPLGHGVRDNSTSTHDPEGNLPGLLRQGGYRLGYFGKTHQVFSQQWDEIFDMYAEYNDYLTERKISVRYPEKPPVEDLCAGISEIPIEHFPETVLTDKGCDFLRRCKQDDQPFLLFLSHEAPHSPWAIPPEYDSLYSLADIQLPEYPPETFENKPSNRMDYFARRLSMVHGDNLKNAVRIYMTLLSIVDENVGRVLKTLDELSLRDNTVILFCADHGDHLGNHGQMGKVLSLDESLIHVPMIFNAPKRFAPKRLDALVESIDISPTLLELAGLEIPQSVQGDSLVPLLAGQTTQHRPCAFSEEHNDTWGGRMSVRNARYKFVLSQDGFEEMYDLQDDPYEWYNVAQREDLQDVKAEMYRHLALWRFASVDRTCPQRYDWVSDFMKNGKMY